MSIKTVKTSWLKQNLYLGLEEISQETSQIMHNVFHVLMTYSTTKILIFHQLLGFFFFSLTPIRNFLLYIVDFFPPMHVPVTS